MDDKESIDKESINSKINDLNEKIKHYDELEKIMDETGENEINLTDNDAKFKEYVNPEACSKCLNREKCTKAKYRTVIKRDKYSDATDRMNDRIENDKTKYSQRKCIVEHPFGTLKRTMNFTYLLLRNFVKVRGEISLAFFSYNL